MTDGFEVDFGLLPRWPMAFFGLEAGFDKKALKRSYNRLIRRFKPEHRPTEFQLIRAGYESLDEALRSGCVRESTAPVGVRLAVAVKTLRESRRYADQEHREQDAGQRVEQL